jgi:hypothetical protein
MCWRRSSINISGLSLIFDLVFALLPIDKPRPRHSLRPSAPFKQSC